MELITNNNPIEMVQDASQVSQKPSSSFIEANTEKAM